MNNRDWKTMKELQALPRELEIQEEVFNIRFTRLPRTMFTRQLKNTPSIRVSRIFCDFSEPHEWMKGSQVKESSAGLYLSSLVWHMNQVGMRKDERKESQQKVFIQAI